MPDYTIIDKATAYISPEAKIGKNTVIKPNTTIEGATVIGEGCVIGPNTILTNAKIADGVTVLMSVVNDATVGEGTDVGPFAHLRPGAAIGKKVRIGNFVEVKKSDVGDGTKISHLTYVGDSIVGKGVNFGCGTVTVNYDGEKKSQCIIEDGAFIGCNTNLIAPVTVGENAYTAAGATITRNVPRDALSLSRVKQQDVEGWAAKRRNKRDV